MIDVQMTSPDGVTLATSGKYCADNVHVSPALQEKTVTPTSEAQTVTADEGYAGLDKVTVEAAEGGGAFPDNAIIKLEDFGEDGYPRTFVYNDRTATVVPPLVNTGNADPGTLPFSKITKIVMPENVTEIGERSFNGLGKYITEIIGWDNVTVIGDQTFTNAVGILISPWPTGLKKIGSTAFRKSGDSSNLPDTVEEIGNQAFSYSWLTWTKLPASLKKIDTNAFYMNNYRTMLVTEIPEFVETIGNEAFTGALHTSIETLTFRGIPASISATAFRNNTYVTTVRVPWSEGEVANAPWGMTNATIIYNYVPEEA